MIELYLTGNMVNQVEDVVDFNMINLNKLVDLEKIDHNGYLRGLTLIDEWRFDDKYQIHKVYEDGKYIYQQGISINRFFRRELDDWYYNWNLKLKKKPRSFHQLSDLKIHMESYQRAKEKTGYDWTDEYFHKDIKSHKSVWEFYEYIGYDYKNKKYIL